MPAYGELDVVLGCRNGGVHDGGKTVDRRARVAPRAIGRLIAIRAAALFARTSNRPTLTWARSAPVGLRADAIVVESNYGGDMSR
ncbi:hypothetical protein AB0D04_42355 [Streptomyces sp. NPDC048483]|uniref:hypothetical protein n=1 Tax=Streptomyces sp. NPDC048483 TaxID=3154927 RepID=UPI00343856F8